MIRYCAFLLIAAATPNLLSAQDTAPQNPPAKPGTLTTAASGEAVNELLKKVQTLHAQQHYFEALQELDKAEALAPDNPIFPNIRGSIYTAMRDFVKARECFELSAKRMPDAFEPKFNLAELLYVQGQFAESEAAFVSLLKNYPKLREEVRHLTQFKVAVCRLKQDHPAEAEEMLKNFTFMDDTPAYYFAKAAMSFQKGDKEDARTWMAKAQRIFKPQQNAPYTDTLMEARWIQSINIPGNEPEPAK